MDTVHFLVKQRKKRSDVWRHFHKKSDEIDGMASCNDYDGTVKCTGGSTNCLKHRLTKCDRYKHKDDSTAARKIDKDFVL